MKTEYDQQAEAFLTKFGIKFRATLSDSKPAPWQSKDGLEGHHYRVTLSRSDPAVIRESWKPLKRLTFDFWGSIADAEAGKTEVRPYDVLASLSCDVHCPASFEDFCSEFGYEADSIKALQMFKRCNQFAKRLRAFFTQQEIKELSTIQ